MKKHKPFLVEDKPFIYEKIKESFSSVLPIIFLVLILSFTIAPVDSGMFLAFLAGAAVVVIGIGFFTLGADVAMTPIGNYIGSNTIKTKKLWVIIPVFFLVGVLITVSEPDLQVLASQLSQSIRPYVLIIAVGIGVGFFLVVAVLKTILNVKLAYILIVSYVAVFVMSFFVPKSFVPLAFDAGGVTTGPMSVPFIIAIGTGMFSLKSSEKGGSDDGFGLTALCSIGPIISVMILGLIFGAEDINSETSAAVEIANSQDMFLGVVGALPEYMKEVAVALLPIVGLFFIFNVIFKGITKNGLIRIIVGILYTFVGLVLFLTGVNFGFSPIGSYMGGVLAEKIYNWILIPIGMIIGFFVVAAEPAVHVLTKQVYEITDGAIPKKALLISLMIGVAISIGLAMLRMLLNISILYFLIPAYVIALALTFVVPDIFTAIAFDSGGVASGAMTASFILPFALGACQALGGNIATEGFGVVAFVAMTPLITIQILGVVYKIKLAKIKAKAASEEQETSSVREEIID